MQTTTLAPPSQVESEILKGFDTLTQCPECQIGTYTLLVFREFGRIRVACGICERARNFADAHTPPA